MKRKQIASIDPEQYAHMLKTFAQMLDAIADIYNIMAKLHVRLARFKEQADRIEAAIKQKEAPP